MACLSLLKASDSSSNIILWPINDMQSVSVRFLARLKSFGTLAKY